MCKVSKAIFQFWKNNNKLMNFSLDLRERKCLPAREQYYHWVETRDQKLPWTTHTHTIITHFIKYKSFLQSYAMSCLCRLLGVVVVTESGLVKAPSERGDGVIDVWVLNGPVKCSYIREGATKK